MNCRLISCLLSALRKTSKVMINFTHYIVFKYKCSIMQESRDKISRVL